MSSVLFIVHLNKKKYIRNKQLEKNIERDHRREPKILV